MNQKQHPAQVENNASLINAARQVLAAFGDVTPEWLRGVLAELERQVVAAEAGNRMPADYCGCKHNGVHILRAMCGLHGPYIGPRGDDQVASDLRLYGSTFLRIDADGTYARLDPRHVTFVPTPEDRPRQVEGVLAVADQAGADGVVFTAETLRGMADGVTKFWDEERNALIYRGPPLNEYSGTDAEADERVAMLRDAARYEWLRERWGCLVSTWNSARSPKELLQIEAPDFRGWSVIDPSSLDRAIDSAMERDDAKDATPR